MFYSHQLLARKASLGQIWMAATLHAKINRRKLDKLNISKICEEILNPAVPMALRLSGILMGGVVIVYQRKVKLFYDDVNRLLVEINEAWKMKAAPDPTVLPKGKSQAKKESVTLPDNEAADAADIEQSLNYSNSTRMPMGLQQTGYFAMRLDSVDESYINGNVEDSLHQHHQAEADNITLFEHFDSYQADANMYNRFERFDIEEDDGTQLNFNSREHTQIPATLVRSPPPPDEPQTVVNEMQYEIPDFQVHKREDELEEVGQMNQVQQRQAPIRRKRRVPAFLMDEQTIIPGPVYQSWLRDVSDIASRSSGRNRKRTCNVSTMKIANLMALPPQVLMDNLFTTGSREIYYPSPLLKQWMKSSQPPHDSPSVRTSPPLPPEPSSLSPPQRENYQDRPEFPFEDFQSGVGSQSQGVPIERQMPNPDTPINNLMDELIANLTNNGARITETNLMQTPENSNHEVRSVPSSASGQGIPSHNSEMNSGRSSKKRPYSASRNSSGGLEPVAEEYPWHHSDSKFKLSGLPENDLTPGQELLVETAPTQTQQPFINHPDDKITDSIRMQMKAHFETPGAPQVESLNNLAAGLNRQGAALLFYQTCVLATRDSLRVEQKYPYGDILISRGAKL
ncbi:sister chromatid cohesion 1 protein 1 isoform X1 [Ziziphus jujuba]|uniref:Sister chromatid cohesion 1 protein 1 isoform X1 n=2 Tax=Ziziphus jujuba TaxID=326968 RepID=A0A6P3ZPX3_ZIZJJ|nr:sister chromatid cohesion 1 protein 1 isoform X1 [Ziziphus jujuba]